MSERSGTALEAAKNAMLNAAAMLRGLQSDVAHHTDLTPEISQLEAAIELADEELR